MCIVLLKASERKQSCDSSLWSDGTSVGMPIALHGDAVPVPLRATVRPLEAPQQSPTWSPHGETSTPMPAGSAAACTTASGGRVLHDVCMLPLLGSGVADLSFRAAVWRVEVRLAPWVGCVDARTHEHRQGERALPDAASSSATLARRCEVRSWSCHRRRLRGSGVFLCRSRPRKPRRCDWNAASPTDRVLLLDAAGRRSVGTCCIHQWGWRVQPSCALGHAADAIWIN